MKRSDSARTVFVAEDNPILLQGLERALTAHGYYVETAGDGEEMLGLLETVGIPDVLLMDVMMPGKTGIEVLDTVRSDERTADVPVLLITAATEEAVPASALKHPYVELLMKPFRLGDLIARLEAQVAQRRQRTVVEQKSVTAPMPG